MGIEDFAEEIVKLLTEKLGNGRKVKVIEVLKNNGVVWHGISILEEGKKVCPCIYVDGYYEGYKNGCLQMEDIAEDIMEDIIADSREGAEEFDSTLFEEYGKAEPRLRGKLVNTEKNREMLKGMPHREFLDLSLIYYVEICMNHRGLGSILVKNGHMEKWGRDEEELYCAVMGNMENDGMVREMMDLVAQIMGVEEPPSEVGGGVELYVLTNEKRADGAVYMMDKRVLREAFRMIGRDFLILPSSVHEVMLAPVEEENYEDRLAKIAQMVREVNNTQLEETEILSYHVYRYYADTEEVAIVA